VSAPAVVDFTLVRGDSKTIYLGIGRDGTRLNLTGATVTGQARVTVDDASVALTFECLLANQTTDPGGVYCAIDKAESALVEATTLVYDIQILFANGDNLTPVGGVITMKKDVTRSV
jgi:hypothetical protein